jgi:predicted Zn-dependent peptidase
MSCDLFEELEDVPIDDLKAPLSLGPKALLHGKLANGITYYIRQSIKPKHRIAVALAVKVGSVNEEEHERGLAHIIEHLAFNATEKMHGHDIVKFLESIGAEFGACQNAYTSSDETVYELLLPSEDGLDHLKSCVEVLSQFAFSIRSSASDLEKERGAVIEEWRQNQDATGRASEAHWKLILKGSRYADRLPIGLPSVIRNVSCDVVKSFYHRHYHPHRMAVCIVGDFGTKSVSEVLDLLNSSDLARNPERLLNTSPIRLNPNFIPHFDPRVAVLVDGESSQGSLYVSFKFKKKTGAWSCSDLLESMCETLFEFCLSSRLFKLARLPDPPFATASISASEPLTATINVRTLSAMLLENKVLDGQNPALRALECLLTEAARVRLHGFKEEEIERAMRSMKSEICQTYRERNEGHATDIRDEYLRHFLSNEIVLGQELEARLYKTLLPRVTKEAIEAVAARFKTHDSCVVKVVEHQRTVNEDAVRALIQKVEAMERQGLLGPFEHHSLVPDHLISPMSIPSPGLISFQETRYGSLGVITEMRLQNGLRVCHKFSDLKEDEVLISGFAFGGLSEVPQDLFITASLTTAIASQLGALGFKPSVLQDVLAGERHIQGSLSCLSSTTSPS